MKSTKRLVASMLGLLLMSAPAGAATVILTGASGHFVNSSSNPSYAKIIDGSLLLEGNTSPSGLDWRTDVPVDGAGVYRAVISGKCSALTEFLSMSGRLVSYDQFGFVSAIGSSGTNPCGQTPGSTLVTQEIPPINVPVNGTLQIQTHLAAPTAGSSVSVGSYTIIH